MYWNNLKFCLKNILSTISRRVLYNILKNSSLLARRMQYFSTNLFVQIIISTLELKLKARALRHGAIFIPYLRSNEPAANGFN